MTEAMESSLVIHFGALPDLKRPISACVRIGRHIFNADSPEKSTKWAKDRKRFQKEIDSKLGLNEVLMTEIVRRDDSVQRGDKDHYDGYVMEGLSSNVAMLMEDNTLLTPSTEMGILPGTVRGFLIDLLERLKNVDTENVRQIPKGIEFGKKDLMEELEKEDTMETVKEKYGEIPKDIKFGKPLFADILKWKGAVIMSTSRLIAPIDTLYIDMDDDEILKVVGNDEKHRVLGLKKSDKFGCGYRKIEFNRNRGGDSECLENLRVFVRDHMKSHSIYVGSVFHR